MKDRGKAPRPSRSSVDGAEKPKLKASSTAQPTKSDPSKSSSSGASKKPTTSSSKSSTVTKSQSSTRTPKTAASTSSSKTRSTVELKPEKSSSKPDISGSKDERAKRTSSKKSNEVQGSKEAEKNDKTSIKKDKAPSRSSREPGKGDRGSSRKTEKDSSTSQNNKPSSRGKGESKERSERKPPREDKSSKSQGKGKDRGRAPESEKGERASSNRRVVGDEKPSSKSSKDSNKSKSSDKSDTKKSSRDESEKVKDRNKSTKGEKKEKSKEDSSQKKTSRSREKSAKRNLSQKEESLIEDRDSGVEGLGIQGSVIGHSPKGQLEAEVVEHNQNSLETMESGISLSTPRDLSGDEAEVEESISSKMVEVDEVPEEGLQDDEDEAMIDDSVSPVDFLDETFPADLQYQNSMDVPASLVSHSDIANVNGDIETEVIEETEEQLEVDNNVGVSNENGTEEPDVEEEYYEEDFEDYESDFEDDTGSGDEDEESEESASTAEASSSGSALPSSAEDSEDETKDPDLEAVLQAIERENNFTYPLERVYTFDDPTQDEQPVPSGEEKKQSMVQDAASKTATKENQNTTTQRPKTSRTFVNFAVAKKKQEAAHINSKMNSRGRILLSMIQLDTVSVDLLTLAPVSYEAYISSFGHSNRQQVTVQTNEDALTEEIQTEPVVMRNKWTQKPVHISIGKDNELPGPEDYMGVGGDMGPLTFSGAATGKSSTSRLTSFLTSASQVMLALLEEELVWETAESDKSDSSVTSEGLGFSQPPVTLGQNVQSLLEGRTTPFVKFCPSEPNLLLSGHGLHSLGEENIEDFKDGGLLCVWWVQEPSRPQHLLSCCSTPTAASFSPARPSLIIAGLEDGSLSTWDLRESLQLHTLKINIDEDHWRVRVPSYITACDESGEGEGSPIVAIHTVTTEEDQISDTHGAFQVVTLTANGRVTWVVMHVPLTSAIGDINFGRKSATVRTISSNVAVSPHLGASPWARIVINRAATINVANTLYGDEAISNEIICHDLKMDMNDSSQLYVATGSGAIAHCSRHSSRIHPKAYYPEFEPGCESLCIALCPHDYRYMLVGSSDGMVRLHSISSERPLTTWQSAPDCAPVKGLQWSPARPCVFYVLDSMARLHIWDLSAGDIFPILTVEAGGLVGGALRSFNIAPTQPTSRHPLYAVFASDGGEMVLRQVGPEFSTHHLQDDYDTELERFTYYVNII
ncbi:cytoplasmic dynein 2 intermediate chain 1-like [Macrobrachium nipponense]|uniref:cytoplasmic dynein 2 intermediate chain 1-like n=1 Tax=Macrobrachium nipponense TaxID=159736 RepID=UPI0030C7E23D